MFNTKVSTMVEHCDNSPASSPMISPRNHHHDLLRRATDVPTTLELSRGQHSSQESQDSGVGSPSPVHSSDWLTPPSSGETSLLAPSPKTKKRLSLKLAMKSPGLKRRLSRKVHIAVPSLEEWNSAHSDTILGVFIGEQLEKDADFEVQRIPEYDRYLNELLSEIDETHPDFDDLLKAASRVQSMVRDRSDEVTMVENESRVERVQDLFPHDDLQLCEKEKQSKLKSAYLSRRRSAPSAVLFKTLGGGRSKSLTNSGSGLSSFALDGACNRLGGGSANRLYITEGPVQLTAGLQTQERYLFLFNDLLLIAKQKSSTAFKLKHRIRICEMWTDCCLDDVCEITKTHDKSFVMGWPTTNTVATFDTAENKENWLEKLSKQIEKEKAKEKPRNIVLKVINKDMNAHAHSKSFQISNTDTATDCVKMCLQQFEIQEGETKDYQLWVVSGKDDSPYPLIGHEQPFSIKMSHIRDATKKPNGEDAAPADIDMTEQLPSSSRCDFILKHTKKPKKSLLDENSKTTRVKKMKRSPIINLFKRSSKHENHLTQQQSSPGSLGKLFGHPLTALSTEETPIPKPVMDLLVQLFKESPYTGGIFRKSANARHVKELKTKLDVGLDVSLDDVNVHVIGATFKDFLRNLPDCIFQCDLYEEWTDTTDITDTKERTEKIKKIMERLPRCNQLLIKHFMCVLHYIDKKADENNMNAFNLAICVGPSLLWPHLTAGPGAHAQASKKVPLFIQYNIENCCDIYGEDTVKVFGEPVELKVRQDSSTDSDSMHSLLSLPESNGLGMRRDDSSSYDSLERDLYSEMELESSPRLMKSHLSPTNLSRDSGLTLSDTQLYEDEEGEANAMATSENNKQSVYMRSLSQTDEDSENMHGHYTSHSFDSALGSSTDSSSQPVPPPRKKYNRRTSEPPLQNLDKHTLRHPSYRAAIAGSTTNSGLGPSIDRSRISYLYGADGYRRYNNNMKRASADPAMLGCVEEHRVVQELNNSYFDRKREALQKSQERNIITKSASGMHLYIDEDLLCGSSLPNNEHMARLLEKRVRRQSSKDTMSPPMSPGSEPSSMDSLPSPNSPRLLHSHKKGPAPSPPTVRSGQNLKSKSSNNQMDIDFSQSYHGTTLMNRISYAPCSLSDDDSSEIRMRASSLSRSAPSSNRNSPTEDSPSDSPCVQSPRASIVSTHSSSAGSTVTLTSESQEGELPPPRPPKPGYLSTTPPKSDIKWKLQDPSLGSPPPSVLLKHRMSDQTGNIRVQMKLASQEFFPQQAIDNAGILIDSPRTDSSTPVVSESDKDSEGSHGIEVTVMRSASQVTVPPDYVEHMRRQSKSVERSASDGMIAEVDRLVSHKHERMNSDEMKRPDRPPSYSEAMHRKSLILSGSQLPVPEITEDEVIKQTVNSARARQLYMESLKKFEEDQQQDSSERHSQMKETVSADPDEEPMYTNENTPVRSKQGRKTPPGYNSRNSPKVSRSKSQNAGNIDSPRRTRKWVEEHRMSNLHRSNSDSSEHLHRIGRTGLRHLTPVHVSVDGRRNSAEMEKENQASSLERKSSHNRSGDKRRHRRERGSSCDSTPDSSQERYSRRSSGSGIKQNRRTLLNVVQPGAMFYQPDQEHKNENKDQAPPSREDSFGRQDKRRQYRREHESPDSRQTPPREDSFSRRERRRLERRERESPDSRQTPSREDSFGRRERRHHRRRESPVTQSPVKRDDSSIDSFGRCERKQSPRYNSNSVEREDSVNKRKHHPHRNSTPGLISHNNQTNHRDSSSPRREFHPRPRTASQDRKPVERRYSKERELGWSVSELRSKYDSPSNKTNDPFYRPNSQPPSMPLRREERPNEPPPYRHPPPIQSISPREANNYRNENSQMKSVKERISNFDSVNGLRSTKTTLKSEGENFKLGEESYV